MYISFIRGFTFQLIRLLFTGVLIILNNTRRRINKLKQQGKNPVLVGIHMSTDRSKLMKRREQEMSESVENWFNKRSSGGSTGSDAKTTSSLSSIVGLLQFFWFCSILLKANEDIFLLLFGLTFVSTLLVYLRLRVASVEYSTGIIFGYFIVAILAIVFYVDRNLVFLTFDRSSFSISRVVSLTLFLLIAVWLVVPQPQEQQHIILGLSPKISQVLLGLWKVGVAVIAISFFLEPMVLLNEVMFAFAVVVDFFFGYFKQKTYQGVYFLSNPVKLFTAWLDGPSKLLKWVILLVVFLLLDFITFNWLTLVPVGLGLFFSIYMLTYGLYKPVDAFKLLPWSNTDEAQSEFLTTLNGIKELEPDDLQQVFIVKEKFNIRSGTVETHLSQGSFLVKLPLAEGGSLGHLFLHLERMSFEKKTKETKEGKQKDSYNFNMSKRPKLVRMDESQWGQMEGRTEQVSEEEMRQLLNIESMDEYYAAIDKMKTGMIKVQDELRARLRGLPSVLSSTENSATYRNGSIQLDPHLVDEVGLTDGDILRVIRGKDEYLFYIKRAKI